MIKAITFLRLISSALSDAPGTLSIELRRSLDSESVSDDGNLQARAMTPGTISESLKNQHMYSYGMTFNVGSDKQSVTVNVDTGSSDLWFRGVSHGFNPYTSTTFRNLSTPWSIGYLDSSGASGFLGEDNFEMSGVPIQNVTFALASQASNNGILGLSYPTGDYPTFLQTLNQNGIVQQQAFSIYLNGAQTDYGQVVFGGVDHAKYNGTLGVVPVVNSDGSNKKRCCFYIMWSGVSIRSGDHSYPFLDFNAPAVLDTGTSYAVAYPEIIDNLAKAMNYTFGAHPKYYTGNCDLSDTGVDSFELSFSGVKIQVPPETLLDTFTDSNNKNIYKNGRRQCQLAISRGGSGDNIILGDMFLRNFYAVFDLENDEIGLANAIFDKTDVSDVEAITSGIPKATIAPQYSSTSFDKNIKSHTDYISNIRPTGSISTARSLSAHSSSARSSSALPSLTRPSSVSLSSEPKAFDSTTAYGSTKSYSLSKSSIPSQPALASSSLATPVASHLSSLSDSYLSTQGGILTPQTSAITSHQHNTAIVPSTSPVNASEVSPASTLVCDTQASTNGATLMKMSLTCGVVIGVSLLL